MRYTMAGRKHIERRERLKIPREEIYGRRFAPLGEGDHLLPDHEILLFHKKHGEFFGTVMGDKRVNVSHIYRQPDKAFVSRKVLSPEEIMDHFPEGVRDYKSMNLDELHRRGFTVHQKRPE